MGGGNFGWATVEGPEPPGQTGFVYPIYSYEHRPPDGAAVIGGDAAESFLGTQGDVWDTQWDMFLALVGALSAQVLLGRSHDRSMAAVVREPG